MLPMERLTLIQNFFRLAGVAGRARPPEPFGRCRTSLAKARSSRDADRVCAPDSRHAWLWFARDRRGVRDSGALLARPATMATYSGGTKSRNASGASAAGV